MNLFVCLGRYSRRVAGNFVLLAMLVLLPASVSLAATNGVLEGSYRSVTTRPKVFITQVELEDVARRINMPGSYSAQRFARLSEKVAHDLATPRNWNVSYSGCDISTYLYAFSYEPEDAASAEHLNAGMRSASPPTGAAVVAARLALYAGLAKAGATVPGGAPSAKQAATLAREILLAWASHGFRDDAGKFRTSSAQFCDETGSVNAVSENQAGLQISRGVIYSVYAQDVLMYYENLGTNDVEEMNDFHSSMFSLVENALNLYVKNVGNDCNRYDNQTANMFTALFAVASLLNDKTRFIAVLSANNPGTPMVLSWTAFIDRVIYGKGDRPNECYKNTGPNSTASKPFFQNNTVEIGEIDDRFRNKVPGQGIAYPMFTLERVLDTAEILRISGFNFYGYEGKGGQSIETALDYYACYATGAGFGKIVTEENSGHCPNFQQYVGKQVSGVDRNVLVGALRYPQDEKITSLEGPARISAASSAFSLDPLLFGRWRN